MSDLISRQAAIDESFEIYVDGQKFEVVQVETLMGLPSAEPKEVYCSMASRTCFANGKEVTWCLTCPHISEEDRELVKKAVEGSGPKTDEENELKFYYVESIDDYWIGKRLGNFYYADWHDGLGFVWSKSRYLPWGEHVVNEQTLWKEHTYPSEPKEIPFTMWIVGFLKKYSADRPKGKWIKIPEFHGDDVSGFIDNHFSCSECKKEAAINPWGFYILSDFCPNCGADMREENHE